MPGLADEIAALATPQTSPDGHRWHVTEWLLVWDNGPDASADVIADLAERYDFVKPVWLSRNFGQHPATLAGMASSSGDLTASPWIPKASQMRRIEEEMERGPRNPERTPAGRAKRLKAKIGCYGIKKVVCPLSLNMRQHVSRVLIKAHTCAWAFTARRACKDGSMRSKNLPE